MKVLVTGAAGFMGNNLVKKLLDNGHQVNALVFKGANEIFIKDLNCEIYYGDITDPPTLIKPLENVELVYHLAALTSNAWTKRVFKVNYEGTKSVIQESIKAGVRRFVYMSSLVVHGFKDFIEADEDTPKIKAKWYKRPYIKSKIKSEQFIQDNKDKIEIVVIRPGFMPFGPHDMLASKELLGRLDKGKSIPNINHGRSKMSYVYAENLCDGLILAGTVPKAAGQAYIIADNEPPYITMKQFMDKLCDEFGVKRSDTSIPYRLAAPFVGLLDIIYRIFLRKKLPLISVYTLKVAKFNLYFHSDKAKSELGYEPKVLLDDGIKKTISWYREFSNLTLSK